MLDLAFKNKYLIIVLMLLIAVISVVVIGRLPVDILPTYKTSAVQVLTLYPGMPAEVMEKDITSRIERWTGQSNGIERQESKSLIGVSVVKDFFREDIDANAALSQVTSLAMSDLYYLPPGTVPPMVMPYDPTASTPLALLAVSSETMSEKELYDIAYFQLRNLLGSVSGIIAPAVYGGKLRRIFMYVYPDKLQAYGLSQTDVMDAVHNSNVMIPTGDVNIGDMNYSVNANGMIPTVDDFNDIVIKIDDDGSPIYLKDIGYSKDASAIQTNVVHINGKRQVYIPIYKRTGGNTIASVDAVKGKLSELKERLPAAVNLDVILDQSTYVRNSIKGMVKEGVIGLILVSLALFFFLGNLRSTFIVALSIPLSAMFAFIGLYFTGDTINSMTLGGIALAIGLLVDDSIVVLENIDQHLKKGKSSAQAAYDGAKEVAMPVLVTTLTIIIVFFPLIFLTGISKYLFTPLAITVSLAMIGSRFISMTLVPIMAASLFKGYDENHKSRGKLTWFERFIQSVTERYVGLIDRLLKFRWLVLGSVAILFAISMVGFGRLGTELFPKMDVGQISMDVRMESGTRLEKTEEVVERIEKFMAAELGDDMNIIISNMGVLNDWPAAYTPNSGTQDGTISIQLKKDHSRSTADYVTSLRPKLKKEFPGVQFIFNTGGIVTSALNFGLPSPIDIQITGNDLHAAHEIAVKVRTMVTDVTGTEDVRIHQRYDHPEIRVEIDRTKASMMGISADGVVKNTVAALNSTVNFKPSFWIDERNGNHYFVGVTYPEVELDNPQSVENITLTGTNGRTTLLKNVAKTSLNSAPIEINHLNIQRVTDVYANVEGRDVGSVSAEIEEKLEVIRADLPDGYKISVRGEAQGMKEGFSNLGLGLILAILLVYLVIVPLLRSFRLPLIIITVVPLGLIGVSGMLLATNTYLNIQSMMGIIMMVGITVAYSNLLVDKMNNLYKEGYDVVAAIKGGVANRFKPIIMTAVVAVFALLPMALGYETGGEANVPLARSIIGGVIAATFLSLFVVPILFFLFTKKIPIKMNTNTTLLIALSSIMSLSACQKSEDSSSTSADESRNTPTVLVDHPNIHVFSSSLQLTGNAKANQKVDIHPMTSGMVKRVLVDIGDAVYQNQLLAELENPELQSEMDKLEAEMKGTKTLYARLKGIYAKTPQLTTLSEVEQAQADYEALLAKLKGTRSQVSFLQIRSPFSGMVVRRFVDKGAVVQSALKGSGARPIFEIQDLNPIRLIVDIPEADAAMVSVKDDVAIIFPEMQNGKFSGKISRISYALNEQTKTMRAEVDLVNSGFRIRPGMYAKVEFKRKGNKDALSVPNEAIGNLKGASFVYVVNNGVVRKVPITIGIRDDQFTELRSGDVKADDFVVVSGKEFCHEGASVETKEITNNKESE